MKPKPHTHPCLFEPQGCTNTVSCSGELSVNHDGHPRVICDSFHDCSGGINAEACEACLLDVCVACEQVVKWEGHAEGCSQELDADMATTAVTDAFARVLKAKENGQ